MIGKQSKNFTVIAQGEKPYTWVIRCECGMEMAVPERLLLKKDQNDVRFCGNCYRKLTPVGSVKPRPIPMGLTQEELEQRVSPGRRNEERMAKAKQLVEAGNISREEINDLRGVQFGALTVLDLVRVGGERRWLCSCICGNTLKLSTSRVERWGKSCRCQNEDSVNVLNRYIARQLSTYQLRKLNLLGYRMGYLKVLKNVGYDNWLCLCNCGNQIIYSREELIGKDNRVSTCGCLWGVPNIFYCPGCGSRNLEHTPWDVEVYDFRCLECDRCFVRSNAITVKVRKRQGNRIRTNRLRRKRYQPLPPVEIQEVKPVIIPRGGITYLETEPAPVAPEKLVPFDPKQLIKPKPPEKPPKVIKIIRQQ